MIALGLDPGLTRAGWGVVETIDNKLKFISVGAISPRKQDDMCYRLSYLYEEFSKIIEAYSPQRIAFEDTFVNSNPASALKLGLARGALIAAAGSKGVDQVSFYAPNTIKKAVTGHGHADKKQVQMMVKQLLPKSVFKTSDESDALAIALCDIFIGKWKSNLY